MDLAKRSFTDLRSWKKFVLQYRQSFQKRFPGYDDEEKAFSSLVLILALLEASSELEDRASLYEEVEELLEGAANLIGTVSNTPDDISLPDKELFLECKSLFDQLEKNNAIIGNGRRENRSLVENLIGDTYQIWSSLSRNKALERIQIADKEIKKEELIAFTQIYTPTWVVDYLLEKTLGQRESSKINSELILDPACGSGHFLLGAFEFLVSSRQKSKGRPIRERDLHQILTYQLHGVDIDEKALQLLALSLSARCKRLGVSPSNLKRMQGIQLLSLAETNGLGSLKKELPEDSPLSKSYGTILTNPPYIGRKLLSREIKNLLRVDYPESSSDLSAAFLKRCLELLEPGGRFGVITQASVLTLPTYKRLRESFLTNQKLDQVVDLGPGIFPNQSGEKINSCLMVFENKAPKRDDSISFLDLKDLREPSDCLVKSSAKHREKKIKSEIIQSIYGYSLNYQIPEILVKALSDSSKLGTAAQIKQGLATTDNKQFLRYIWQVPQEDLNRIWFPYAKGAGSSRWYSPVYHVVDWQDNGDRIKQNANKKYPYLSGRISWVVKNESHYFKPGLVFSFVNKHGLNVRKLPSGCIFDVGASAIFAEEIDNDFLLGYLNSSLVNAFMTGLNPTINNQVGDLKKIPVPLEADPGCRSHRAEIADLARSCYQIKREIFHLSDPISYYLEEDAGLKNQRESHFQSIFSLADLERSWEKFHKKISRLSTTLRSLEEEIDDAVLSYFIETKRWKQAEVSEIKNWLERQSSSQKARSLRKEEQKDSSLKKHFECLYLFHKKFQSEKIREDETISLEQFSHSSLDKFTATDFQEFLEKSFHGAPALSDI